MKDTRDTSGLELAGKQLCLDFANTVAWRRSDSPQEELSGYPDLVTWCQHADVIPAQEARYLLKQAARRPDAARAALERALVLREAIYRIMDAVTRDSTPEASDVATLNEFLSEAMSHLQLILTADGLGWTWVGAESSLQRVLWPVAHSAAELLLADELSRVGVCADEGCGWLFVDRSKNQSRRWCSMEDCGNRAKARRHYRRSCGLEPDC
jgi:predicted RNA-binding Zn ribbon-like protein